MAHPKRKISKTRRDKRRTHDVLHPVHYTICPTTGVAHMPHEAYTHDGKLYYRGKVMVEKDSKEEL